MEKSSRSKNLRAPLLRSSRRPKVALLGRGAVGGGVYQRLTRAASPFELVGCAVRDRRAHAAAVPAALLSIDPFEVIGRDADVVVELIGGLEPARSLVAAALGSGRHVVTANKHLIATAGDELAEIARGRGVTLAYSAAVGGGLPVLETIDRLRGEGRIASVRGVLSGTANFVLSALAGGAALEDAVAEAQRLGLAEADPSRDLDGTDVAEKLAIVIRHAFGRAVSVGEIPRRGIADAVTGAQRIALVASASRDRDGGALRFAVGPEKLEGNDELAGLTGAENRVVIESAGGGRVILDGLGAGRWPTTSAVMADISAILAGPRRPKRVNHACVGEGARPLPATAEHGATR